MVERPINERVRTLEVQVSRIVADIESEKGTRSRANEAIDTRLRGVERANWMGVGALMLFQLILVIVLAVYAKH
jgi:hypothetical protein